MHVNSRCWLVGACVMLSYYDLLRYVDYLLGNRIACLTSFISEVGKEGGEKVSAEYFSGICRF